MEIDPRQIEAYRRMTPTEKLSVAGQLWLAARALKAAGLRAQHPEWTEEHLQQRVREIFLYART